jgi:hypothetical protein
LLEKTSVNRETGWKNPDLSAPSCSEYPSRFFRGCAMDSAFLPRSCPSSQIEATQQLSHKWLHRIINFA